MWDQPPLEQRHDDGYELSADPTRIDLPLVHHWLSTDSYWAFGRSVEQMRAAIDGSEPFGIYRGSAQVAIARVVTDGAIFAYLCDVYVDRAHRGKGLGGWLVGHLRDHYAARGLRRFLLATRDAHGVYAPHGFAEVEPGRWMECDLRLGHRPATASRHPEPPSRGIDPARPGTHASEPRPRPAPA